MDRHGVRVKTKDEEWDEPERPECLEVCLDRSRLGGLRFISLDDDVNHGN